MISVAIAGISLFAALGLLAVLLSMGLIALVFFGAGVTAALLT